MLGPTRANCPGAMLTEPEGAATVVAELPCTTKIPNPPVGPAEAAPPRGAPPSVGGYAVIMNVFPAGSPGMVPLTPPETTLMPCAFGGVQTKAVPRSSFTVRSFASKEKTELLPRRTLLPSGKEISASDGPRVTICPPFWMTSPTTAGVLCPPTFLSTFKSRADTVP